MNRNFVPQNALGINVKSCFGHEILACLIAKHFDQKVYVIPQKSNCEEYENESKKIIRVLSFFYPAEKIISVAFEQREEIYAQTWDFVSDLCSEKIDDALWDEIVHTRLEPQIPAEMLPAFESLNSNPKTKIGIVPGKLVSDGRCKLSAEDQSLPVDIYDFLPFLGDEMLVFCQHFSKTNDLGKLQEVKDVYPGIYIPGETEEEHTFGIRGVDHSQFYNMYASLNGVIGIAGTHTWIMMAMFPYTAQIVLNNTNGVEHWEAIAAAKQRAGYPFYQIGYNADSDLFELKEDIEDAYYGSPISS